MGQEEDDAKTSVDPSMQMAGPGPYVPDPTDPTLQQFIQLHQQASQAAAQNAALKQRLSQAQAAGLGSGLPWTLGSPKERIDPHRYAEGRVDVHVISSGRYGLRVTVLDLRNGKKTEVDVRLHGWFGRRKSERRIRKDVDRAVAQVLERWEAKEREDREEREADRLAERMSSHEHGSYRAREVRDA